MHFTVLSVINLDVISLFKTAAISSKSLDFHGIQFFYLDLSKISLPLMQNFFHVWLLYWFLLTQAHSLFPCSMYLSFIHNYLNCYSSEVRESHTNTFQTYRKEAPTMWKMKWVSGCINRLTKAIALAGTRPRFHRVYGRKVSLLNVINFLPPIFLFISSSSLTITFLTSKKIST